MGEKNSFKRHDNLSAFVEEKSNLSVSPIFKMNQLYSLRNDFRKLYINSNKTARIRAKP